MKKLLAITTIALCVAACNSSSTEKTTITTDSISTESPLMDAVNTADSASQIMHDSTSRKPDTIIKK